MAANSAWLAAALLFSLLVAAPIAGFGWGMSAARDACFACLICLLAGLAGFLVSERFRRSGNQIGYLFGGLLPRMFIPLAACLVVYALGGPLAEGKLIYSLLFFYLVALATETYLAISQLEAHAGSQ